MQTFRHCLQLSHVGKLQVCPQSLACCRFQQQGTLWTVTSTSPKSSPLCIIRKFICSCFYLHQPPCLSLRGEWQGFFISRSNFRTASCNKFTWPSNRRVTSLFPMTTSTGSVDSYRARIFSWHSYSTDRNVISGCLMASLARLCWSYLALGTADQGRNELSCWGIFQGMYPSQQALRPSFRA